MTEIRLHIHHTIPEFYDLFEAEISKKNISVQIKDRCDASDIIIILVDTKTKADEEFVRELATLCFAPAYEV